MGQKMPVVRIDLSGCSSRPQWYTVVTKINYEKKFAHDLMLGLKNASLEDQILEVVVPIRETKFTVINKSGKQIEKINEEKIYPAYVFVKAIMIERAWDYIRNTPGTSMIMAAGGSPLIVPEADIIKIKDQCGILHKDKEVKAQNFNSKVGDNVRIIVGPFAGYYGAITTINLNKGKITLKLENGLPLEVDITTIEAN